VRAPAAPTRLQHQQGELLAVKVAAAAAISTTSQAPLHLLIKMRRLTEPLRCGDDHRCCRVRPELQGSLRRQVVMGKQSFSLQYARSPLFPTNALFLVFSPISYQT
jgi:hypothetical protein